MIWTYQEFDIEVSEFEKSNYKELKLDVRGCTPILIENLKAWIHARPYLTYSYFLGDHFIHIYKTPYKLHSLINDIEKPNIKEEDEKEEKPNEPSNDDPWGITNFGIQDFGV